MLDEAAACCQTTAGLVCPVYILTIDLHLGLRRAGGCTRVPTGCLGKDPSGPAVDDSAERSYERAACAHLFTADVEAA